MNICEPIPMDRDHVLAILKRCFPEAESIRIVCNQVEDGQRHHTSDISRITVEYDQDGAIRRRHVAIKRPTSSSISSFMESLNLYEREISMYEKVIPRINEYLDKSLAPGHLCTTESKILVLEDLTARGYGSGEKLPLLDFCRAKGVMKALAHFHAASHKLYEEDPSILTNLLKAYMNGIQFEKLADIWGGATLELLKRKNETRLIPKVEAAISFFKRSEYEITAVLDKSNFKFIVLNHGDGRKDNCLFKQAANNEVQVQFVDYQCCFWSSPAFDLIYFLTTSISADVLEAHFDDLVDEYLNELNKKLEKLECASTYQRTDFDEDFKILKYFLFFSFLNLCVVVGPMNTQQLGESVKSSVTDTSYIDLCLNDEDYVHAVYGWLKYFEKSKFFNEF